MDINTTIVVSYICYHREEIIGPYEIRTCEIVQNALGELYHVIYFTKPIDSIQFRNIKSIHCRYTDATLVDEAWENISLVPLASLYSMGNKTNILLLNDLITQLVQSICEWTITNHINILLKVAKTSSYKTFLLAVSAFGQSNDQFRYIHLNRFTLENITNYNTKNKFKALHNQLSSIMELLKILFFRKLTTKALRAKTFAGTCLKCKIFNYEERFLNFNKIDLHTLFCQTETKGDQLEMLKVFYPSTKEILTQAIIHVAQTRS